MTHMLLARRLPSPLLPTSTVRGLFRSPTARGPFCVRGLFSAKVPNSSFAEVRMGHLIQPTHMEDENEDEDQENEKEDERDGE